MSLTELESLGRLSHGKPSFNREQALVGSPPVGLRLTATAYGPCLVSGCQCQCQGPPVTRHCH